MLYLPDKLVDQDGPRTQKTPWSILKIQNSESLYEKKKKKQWETIIRNWLKSLLVEKKWRLLGFSKIFLDMKTIDCSRPLYFEQTWRKKQVPSPLSLLFCAGIQFFWYSTSTFNDNYWFPIRGNRGLSKVYGNKSLFILGTYSIIILVYLCTFTEMLPGHQISETMKAESL